VQITRLVTFPLVVVVQTDSPIRAWPTSSRRQSEPRQPALRLGRGGHVAARVHGDDEPTGRRRHRSHPIQRLGAVDDGLLAATSNSHPSISTARSFLNAGKFRALA